VTSYRNKIGMLAVLEEATTKVIDLEVLGVLVFAGREHGARACRRFEVNELARSDSHIVINVPSGTRTMSSSFLLGMFRDAIRCCGSRDAFLAKFEFRMPGFLSKSVDNAIERALRVKKPLMQ